MRRVDHVYNLSRDDSARYTASPQTSGANIPRFVCQDDMHLQDRALVNNTPVGGRGSEGEDSLRSGPTTHFPAMERLFRRRQSQSRVYREKVPASVEV